MLFASACPSLRTGSWWGCKEKTNAVSAKKKNHAGACLRASWSVLVAKIDLWSIQIRENWGSYVEWNKYLLIKLLRGNLSKKHTHTSELPLCPGTSKAFHYRFSNQVKSLFTTKQHHVACVVLLLVWWMNYCWTTRRSRWTTCWTFRYDKYPLQYVLGRSINNNNIKIRNIYNQLHGKIWTQLIDLAPNVWLHSSVGRASHQYREVTGSNPVEALNFFRLLLSNCLNWKIYCDNHSSLSSTTAVQIWIISYKLHIT